MKSPTLARIAASALVLGITTMGCTPAGQAARPSSASDSKLAKVAIKSAARAAKAMAKKDLTTAVTFSEAAVAAMPRDANYRMLLGQTYLAAGRFVSAETSFMDTLTLDPEHAPAALNLALVEIALGKKDSALRTLGDYRDKLTPSDYGLALALAGNTEAAVAVLEVAIRAGGADAKTRQNLALAYALSGKWNNARVMATQDLAPVDADARIISWMSFVRPEAPHDQVASLLGVTPVEDGGQPTRLALAPAAAPVAVAAVEVAAVPTPPAPAPAAAPAPVVETAAFEVAAVEVAPPVPPAPVIIDTPPPVFEVKFAARSPIVQPIPAQPTRPVRVVGASKRQAVVPAVNPRFTPRAIEAGKFVVQLGAFGNVASAERGWKTVSGRFGLTSYEPANANARVNGANYVRLAVGGFTSRAEAVHVCTRIRNAGGKCFVRGLASDAPAQWVQRGLPKRLASR